MEMQKELNQAFVENAVLVIRAQTLKAEQFLKAIEIFGTVYPQQNKRFALPECPLIRYISNQDHFDDGKR